ncbi:UNVERIFIED_CONTAM: hypothetical protein GTU68_030045, partial [Idotea baltica]|nr:hypothetical protein [Idotea baltica]
MTKVFFRPGKFAEFDQMMKSDPENLKVLVERVKKWLLVSRWKKAIWGALSVIKLKNKILYRREKIVILQKNIRMCNARRKHAHRFKGVMQIKGLQGQLKLISDIIGQLKKDKESSVMSAKKIQAGIDKTILKIKSSPMTRSAIDSEYQVLVGAVNAELSALRRKLEGQKEAEEQARLRKIQ